MKKTSSILLIALFLLASNRANGQGSNITNNYWGGGAPSTYGVSISGGHLSSAPTNPGFSCSSGLLSKKKSFVPQSYFHIDSTLSPCGLLGTEEYALESNRIQPEGYDTARVFLEHCPFYPEAWRAFSDINGDESEWTAGGPGRWPDFLSFLKQVLYLNPDTNWYCNDVDDMLSAVQNNAPAAMSICKYILESGKCPALAAGFATTYNAAASSRHWHWLDSILKTFKPGDMYLNDSINIDTLAHPFTDTVVPTLFQDSLEILMGPQFAGVQSSSPITSQALLTAQLLENPVKDEIHISYQMGRTALVTMELRDVLGRSVPIGNVKYQLELPGSHQATLPAPNLPPGTYYLRITTDAGDAITLKVAKE